jgi:hypothetical protein
MWSAYVYILQTVGWQNKDNLNQHSSAIIQLVFLISLLVKFQLIHAGGIDIDSLSACRSKKITCGR